MHDERGLTDSSGKLSAYQRRLFVFLSVANFFEGYDFIALTQILPNFRADMGVDKSAAGWLVGFINAGTLVAYLLVRRADRWGRRRVLTVTIAGYTVFTFLSGVAPNVYLFGVFQFLARVFLIAEWATSQVIAAEEFPAERRGLVIGVLQGFTSLGAITCAGLVPVMVRSPLGWRTVYLVAILPLVILAYGRRNLRETRRFDALSKVGSSRPFLYIWTTPHRRRVVQLGLIWFVSYIATQNAVTFWKDFALTERGMSDAQVGGMIVIAAVVSMPLVFFVGKSMDVVGRRHTAAVVFSVGAVATYLLYSLESEVGLTVALTLGIFMSSAYLPVLNAFTTELFPTEMRGDGFAWANNLLGRMGYMVSPVVIGYLAEDLGWGPVIRSTAVFPVATLLLIYWLLPETRSKRLEDTAAV